MANTPKVVDREALKEFRKRNDQRYVLEGEYSPNTRVGESDVAENLTPYSEQSGATDTTPFVFQSSGGSSDIGSLAYLKALRGNTVVFNQLVQHNQSSETINGITFTNNGDGTWTVNGTATTNTSKEILSRIVITEANKGKYLITGCPTGGSMITYSLYNSWMGGRIDAGLGIIQTYAVGESLQYVIRITNGTTVNNLVFRPRVINLTLMFGAGNEPTTVAEFNHLFPKPYYEYNAGTLLNCKVNGYKTVGYNAFDGELERGDISNTTGEDITNNYYARSVNFIKVVAGQTYSFESVDTNMRIDCYEYDGNYNFIQQDKQVQNAPKTISNNCRFIKIRLLDKNSSTTVVSLTQNVSIHLTWDGTRTGYEPYETNTYPMPNVELKSAGSVYDELKPDGTLIRRVGVVDLGTLNWSYDTSEADHPIFVCSDNIGLKPSGSAQKKANMICSKYALYTSDFPSAVQSSFANNAPDKSIASRYYGNILMIKDSAYTDAATFKSAMSGVLLYYELVESTEEAASGYQEITPIDDWGTQEFLYDDTIDIPVPQGNEFFYPVDYKAFIDSLGGREDVEYDAGQLVSRTQLNNFLKTITGYDATKTQTLKNVSGTIQWVDEE